MASEFTTHWKVNASGDLEAVTSKKLIGDVEFDDTGLSLGATTVQEAIEKVAALESNTGIISGGLSINGVDPATFDHPELKFVLVDDWTDPENPVRTRVTVPAASGVAVTNLATSPVTFVLVSSAGVILQQTTPPTTTQLKTYAYLGQLGHSNNTSIANAVYTPLLAENKGHVLIDLLEGALGSINEGVGVQANGANLNIDLIGGTIFRRGINAANSLQSPNEVAIAAAPATAFRLRTRTGAGATGATELDVGNYDAGGAITAITGVKYGNWRVYLIPTSGNLVIQYPQTVYSQMSLAIDGLASEAFALLPNLAGTAILVGVIAARSTATDLSDDAQARFFPVDRFGGIGSAVSGASGLIDHNATLNQTVGNPHPQYPYTYDTAADLLADVDTLTIGDVVHTRGALAKNDGGGGQWEIVALGSYVTNTGTINVGAINAAIRKYTGPVEFAWWGPDTTGATDITAKHTSMLSWAWRSSDWDVNEAIEYPKGAKLLFTTDNPFGIYANSTAPARRNVKIIGNDAQLILRPGGAADNAFFDCDNAGTPTDNQLLRVTFRDLRFKLDSTGKSGGSMWGFILNPKTGAPSDNFRLINVDFEGDDSATYMRKVFRAVGTIMASANFWLGGKIRGGLGAVYCSNPQAVVWSFHGVDCENYLSDVVEFAGGGSLDWFGGSFVSSTLLASDAFILNLSNPSGNLGTSFNFYGPKTELYTAFAKIYKAASQTNNTVTNFIGGNFATASGGSRNSIDLLADSNAKVYFDRCDMRMIGTGAHGTIFRTPIAAGFWVSTTYQAHVEFRNCRLEDTAQTDVTWESGARGHYEISGGDWRQTLAVGDPDVILDTVQTGAGFMHPRSAMGAKLKGHVSWVRRWPTTAANCPDASCMLPPNAWLRRVHVKKATSGGATESYQLAVVNADASYVYGLSAVGAFGTAEHEILVNDINRYCADATNREVVITSTVEVAYTGASGAFTVPEPVSDGSVTGVIVADTGSVLTIVFATGTFSGTLTGGTSGETATFSSQTSRRGGANDRAMNADELFSLDYYG